MNIPNFITVTRFFLIPIYLWVFFSDVAYVNYWILFIILLAGLTDIVDGYLARKYRQITPLGVMLDPLADKLMLTAVFLSFFISNKISIWVSAAILIRETLMILGSLIFRIKTKQTIAANFFGKVTTVGFYIALILIIFDYHWAESFLWIIVFLSYLTSIIYLFKIRENGHIDAGYKSNSKDLTT